MAHAHAHGHKKNYKGIMDWITTVDHKKIGLLYLVAGGVFFLIAGLEAILIRLQLIVPMNTFLDAQTFNELITMHGTTTSFLAALPNLLTGFFKYIIPLQLGARTFVSVLELARILDVRLRRFDAEHQLLYRSCAGFRLDGISAAVYDVLGWTGNGLLFDRSYRSLVSERLLGAIYFIVTIINMRAPGMTLSECRCSAGSLSLLRS